MNFPGKIAAMLIAVLISAASYAQNVVTATLQDASNGEPIGFATVSLTKKGATKPAKYTLSAEDGKVSIDGVRAGTYTFKAEMMGYHPFSKEITMPQGNDLGVIKLKTDTQQLDAASVSAVGNPIVIKKDTIEYNATSFKTTENDVLEDLLKKLPGVEIDESGAISVNGQTISKITIDGKTFFLDDPQIASKNIPAKLVNKLKVIQKKSDQAAFTGIDDGEEEHVIDLSIKPGMMKGVFGNIMGGAGRDIPSTDVEADYRFQGAGFVGKFTDKTQLSLLLNANNTNNRGFNDLAGSMMGNQRGGGGGMGGGRGGNWGDNGITTSYMGGANGAWTLFDGDMDLAANYMYTNTDKSVEETSSKTTYLSDHNLLSETTGLNSTATYGNRFGMRLEHKFSENTSIIFEPQVNFGGGAYAQSSDYTTRTDLLNGTVNNTNEGSSINGGDNKNFNASGFFLLRQRLGIPGRTLTAMSRYAFSNNTTEGFNRSVIRSDYAGGDVWNTEEKVDQTIDQDARTSSLFGRVTYTEPLGNHFYIEANYGFRWGRSESEKDTYDNILKQHDVTYSNSIINESTSHNIGANMLYQMDKMRAQLGFSANPTHTFNSTTRGGKTMTYTDDRWKFSPRVMLWWDINDNNNARLFYRGSSEQPSTSQLMPVPDNTNPLNVSFGNPSLAPYFAHNIYGEYSYNNKKKFISVNSRLDGGFTQDPIVNAIWYDAAGVQYSMPFNGPLSSRLNANVFASVPIGKSNFSINNFVRFGWNQGASYVGGSDLNISSYYVGGELDYDKFLKDYEDGVFKFAENQTKTISVMDRFRVRYRADDLELSLSGRTRMNRSWYTISTLADNTTTWNNQIRAEANWTVDVAGLTLKSEFNYNWYRGYMTEQPSEYILNAELQKLLFKKAVTLAVKGYDILGQAKNLSVTDNANFHNEVRNNTLGRYIILSLTFRFGTFDGSRMRGGPGMGGPGGRGGYGGGRR